MGINSLKDFNIKVYIGEETYSFSNVQYRFCGPSEGGPKLEITSNGKIVTEFVGCNFSVKINRANPLS